MTDFIIELAILGDIGTFFVSPGAIAAILGVIWFWLLYSLLRRFTWIAVWGQIFLAVGMAATAEAFIAIKDPGRIVIDEFVAVGIIFLGVKSPTNYRSVLLLTVAVIIFLLLDWLKPLGISYIELLPSGVGIVADDVAAALVARGFMWFAEEKKIYR